MAKQHAQSQRAQREVSGRGPCTQSRQQTVVEPFSRSKPQLQSRQKPILQAAQTARTHLCRSEKSPHRRSRNHLGRSELAGLCGTYEKRTKRLEKNR